MKALDHHSQLAFNPEEENKILDLQLKDINSRLDAISAQVEDSNSLYKKPTTVKAFKQKLEKM